MSLNKIMGRVVDTPFGQISDGAIRVGKYHLHMLLLLITAMFGKGLFLVGVFVTVITIIAYTQSPIARYLVWKKTWFNNYFYAHLVVSVVVGILINPSHEHIASVTLYLTINMVFAMVLMNGFSKDFEELMNGQVQFNV